jgi:6-pyruvoyltetrahydropterin/6-carboxytetrahydropterin synthase
MAVMFELSVETTFAAAHAIVIKGDREAVHGHNWQVTVTVSGAEVDGDGLLVDFHALERVLADVTRPFRNGNLNQIPPFDRVNPTAENVARHIGKVIEERLGGPGAPRKVARVSAVRVTEAPGCAVVYRPALSRDEFRAE